MIFGPCPTNDALGCILAHGLRAGDINFKKGRMLSADDIETLVRSGIRQVIAARIVADELVEDMAANLLVQAATGDGVRASAPFTGRANLYARYDGLVDVAIADIDAFNSVDEAITMATLRPFERVATGQMLATIKIIPFAVPASVVENARQVAPRLSVRPYLNKTIALISTRLDGMKDTLLDKNRQALQQRLDRTAGTIIMETRVAHDETSVAEAIGKAMSANAELIFIFGASAIVDRRDVIPAGIMAAGGTVHHFGMPVDPGNLLLLGSVGTIPTIGLPGCARSPKLNGFDWVLERLLCDIAVTRMDITRMGAGGLLKEIPTRPQPREGVATEAARAPKIGAILLAAGKSSRMGSDHKLLMEIDGKPLIRHALEALLAAGLAPIVVVTGYRSDDISALIAADPVKQVVNPDYAAGMSSSLRAGINAMPPDIDAVLIALGDMPAITSEHITRMVAAFDPDEGRSIVVATSGLKRGNPVMFATRFRKNLASITGDTGARQLISEHLDEVVEVDLGPGALIDLDTPDAIAAYRGKVLP